MTYDPLQSNQPRCRCAFSCAQDCYNLTDSSGFCGVVNGFLFTRGQNFFKPQQFYAVFKYLVMLRPLTTHLIRWSWGLNDRKQFALERQRLLTFVIYCHYFSVKHVCDIHLNVAGSTFSCAGELLIPVIPPIPGTAAPGIVKSGSQTSLSGRIFDGCARLLNEPLPAS